MVKVTIPSFLIIVILSSCGAVGGGFDLSRMNGSVDDGSRSPNALDEFEYSAEAQVFRELVYPRLRESCVTCHATGERNFASDDAYSAYEAVVARSLVDLVNPSSSRFVYRLANEHHNCGSFCESWAQEIEDAVVLWKTATQYRDRPLADTRTRAIQVAAPGRSGLNEAPEGVVVLISAPAKFEGRDFREWQANISVEHANDSATFFVMPHFDVSLTPLYAEVQSGAGPVQTANVVVNRGNGDGEYWVGDQVEIEALNVPSPYRFQSWLGAVSLLPRTDQANVSFILGQSGRIEFTAKYGASDGRSFYLSDFFRVPGLIEAEHFDQGPAGLTYFDTDASNVGGALRTTGGVDIWSNPTGFQVGSVREGEWLEYSVWVERPGNYRIRSQLAQTRAGGEIRFEFNGVNKTGTIAVPVSGSFRVNASVDSQVFSLDYGPQRVRVVFQKANLDGWVGDIDRFEFIPVD